MVELNIYQMYVCVQMDNLKKVNSKNTEWDSQKTVKIYD